MCLRDLQPRRVRVQGLGQGRLPLHAGLRLRATLPLQRLRLLQPSEVT